MPSSREIAQRKLRPRWRRDVTITSFGSADGASLRPGWQVPIPARLLLHCTPGYRFNVGLDAFELEPDPLDELAPLLPLVFAPAPGSPLW